MLTIQWWSNHKE